MTGKNLLVITNSFPDEHDKHTGGIFVKGQLKATSPHFENVYVVYPSALGRGHRPKADFADYGFGNVRVFFLRYFNAPLFLHIFRGVFPYLMSRAVDRLVRREGLRFDLIHAHFTWPSGRAAVRLKRKYGVPLVVTEHTSLTLAKAVARKDPQFVDTWMASDAVVRVRKGDLDVFSSVGVPKDRVHFIPNGFDGQKFRPLDKAECRIRLGVPTDTRMLVGIGMLDEVKGYRHLIDAIAEVAKDHRDLICYIVGGGPLEDDLRGYARSKGLEGAVTLVGLKPHGELPYWINASDMVVHASLSESGPMVMFEALGCGKPFIGTRVGSVPDVITSDEYGLISEPGDSSALAKNIVRALEKDWDAKRIEEHSRQYASEWASRELIELYDRLLSKR